MLKDGKIKSGLSNTLKVFGTQYVNFTPGVRKQTPDPNCFESPIWKIFKGHEITEEEYSKQLKRVCLIQLVLLMPG